MRRHISKMLLYLLHLYQAETWLIWFIIHLEVLDLFKLFFRLPPHSLGGLLLLWRLAGSIFIGLGYYSLIEPSQLILVHIVATL
jgi:hypothetical protein